MSSNNQYHKVNLQKDINHKDILEDYKVNPSPTENSSSIPSNAENYLNQILQNQLTLTSSVKYQSTSLNGLNKDQIIERYEQLLSTREKQMKEMATEFGILNERLSDVRNKT